MVPHGYQHYIWKREHGYESLGNQIEKAARKAGR